MPPPANDFGELPDALEKRRALAGLTESGKVIEMDERTISASSFDAAIAAMTTVLGPENVLTEAADLVDHGDPLAPAAYRS